jgi:hypothetical protein
MSRKTTIMLGMVLGSVAGGFIASLFGAGAFSFTSLGCSTAGGLLGIWIAFKIS